MESLSYLIAKAIDEQTEGYLFTPQKKNFIFPISIKKNEAKDSKKSNNLEKIS